MKYRALIASMPLLALAACTQPYGAQGTASTEGGTAQQSSGHGTAGGAGMQGGAGPGMQGAAGMPPCPGMMGGPGMAGAPGMMGHFGGAAGGMLPGVSGLTDEQRKSIGVIMDDFRKKQAPLMQQMHQQMMGWNFYRGGTMDRAAADQAYDAANPIHRQMFYNMMEMRGRIDQVLTAQQRAEWQRSWHGGMWPGQAP